MKVERHTGLHLNAKQAVPPAASWAMTGTQRSFESALREQRQRIAPSDKGSQQRPDASSSRLRSVAATINEGDRSSTRFTAERATSSADRRQISTAAALVEDSLVPPFIDQALAARWRRTASARGPECIEVVHAASGSRFLLSREDGVWLLALQSKGSPQDESLVQALRELFAERGLGPLDIINI